MSDMAINIRKDSPSGDPPLNPSDEGSQPTAGGTPQMTQSDIAAMAMGQRVAVSEQAAGSYTWAAIVGLVCVILLIALVLIQVMENSYYQGAIPITPYVAGTSAR
ncbi:MAG: hypothetical protein ACUVWX_03930 [Kiritimatiellia bacterium]